MSSSSQNTVVPQGIDPRSPRFGAGITAILLVVVIALSTSGPTTQAGSTLQQRVTDPAFLLLTALALLFAWGAFAGIRRHPYGVLFRAVIRPRLAPPAELEDPRPPTFAQGVGLFVVGAGLVLSVLGVPWAILVAASAAFIAAFLNAVFDFCLGCQIYLLLQRITPRSS